MTDKQYGFRIVPGATMHKATEDPDVRADNRCRQVGEVHFCAASRMSLGFEGHTETNETGVGLLFLTRNGGGVGLSIALTPTAMRSFAAKLVDMAGTIESKAQAEASAVLTKAAGK